MIARIKRLAKRNKGMEALQAVLLLGAGFLIVWGLMTLWSGTAQPVADKNVQSIISGTPKQ